LIPIPLFIFFDAVAKYKLQLTENIHAPLPFRRMRNQNSVVFHGFMWYNSIRLQISSSIIQAQEASSLLQHGTGRMSSYFGTAFLCTCGREMSPPVSLCTVRLFFGGFLLPYGGNIRSRAF
jgi:hypothetical protein